MREARAGRDCYAVRSLGPTVTTDPRSSDSYALNPVLPYPRGPEPPQPKGDNAGFAGLVLAAAKRQP